MIKLQHQTNNKRRPDADVGHLPWGCYMTRYIDPRTDFGFKRLFGREDSKEILQAVPL